MNEGKPRRGAAIRFLNTNVDITIGRVETRGQMPDGSPIQVIENEGAIKGLKIGTVVAPGAKLIRNTGTMEDIDIGQVFLQQQRPELDVERLRELLKDASPVDMQPILEAAQQTRSNDPTVVGRAVRYLIGAADKLMMAIATKEGAEFIHHWISRF